jgi:hypothetical protein
MQGDPLSHPETVVSTIVFSSAIVGRRQSLWIEKMSSEREPILWRTRDGSV